MNRAQSIGAGDDAAVDAFGRQVARLVVEPEALPFLLDLPQVFRLVQQLVHPLVRIAGILIDEATGVGGQPDRGRDPQHHSPAPLAVHGRLRARYTSPSRPACQVPQLGSGSSPKPRAVLHLSTAPVRLLNSIPLS